MHVEADSVSEYRKARDGKIFIRLDEGDEITSAIRMVCEKEGIGCAMVFGIGACRKAEIAHYDTLERRYHNKQFEGMLEIVSLLGDITLKDGRPFPHLHISLGLKDFSAAGGHLVSCDVNPTCEITIMPLDIPIHRGFHERSGLFLAEMG
jgi:predicted DNA-binding protein with PD1-like motif